MRASSLSRAADTSSAVPYSWPSRASSNSVRSRAVIGVSRTVSTGTSGGNAPWVREYAVDHASGSSSLRASSVVAPTATVPETTT